MKTPNFSQDQYIDAPTLNAASALVSGDFALAAGLFKPGLVFPEANSYPVTGLAVTANLPSPFAVLFGNGLLAQAHGTVTGQDTQAYSVNFSGAVPATGSTTAYLVANYAQIQQGSFQVIGPPVGHPDYNPNFTPYTAYSQNVDSLSVAVTTTPPDNSTSVELFRTTLAAGATGVAINTIFQQRAGDANITQTIQVSGAYQVLIANAGRRHQITAAATVTLPAVSGCNGLSFPFSSITSGAVTLQTTGNDRIYGTQGMPASGVAQTPLVSGQAFTVEADDGIWQTYGASPIGRILLTAATGFFVSTTGSDTTGNGSASAPWATLQHAWNVLQSSYDLGGQLAVINVANGAYAAGVAAAGTIPGQNGPGSVIFAGNAGSPSSVTINSNQPIFSGNGSAYTVQGFQISSSGAPGWGISAAFGGYIQFSNLIFGSCTSSHIIASAGASVVATGPYSIAAGGNAPTHLDAHADGVVQINGITVTGAGASAIAFATAFAASDECGVIEALSASFTNVSGITGQRYLATLNSVINTGGGGANFFPGNSGGITQTGGQYA